MKKFTVGVLALLVLSTLVYALAYTDYVKGVVTGHQWYRSLVIERYQTNIYEAVGVIKPGAYDVESWDDGYFSLRTDSNGNLLPVWNEDIRHNYKVDEWTHTEDIPISALNKSPRWPDWTPQMGPLGELDRIRARKEEYMVLLDIREAHETWTYFCAQSSWMNYTVGEEVLVELGSFGRIVNLIQLEEVK